MALLFGRQRRVAELVGYYGDWAGAQAQELVLPRGVQPSAGLPPVSVNTAMRHSGVWACLRLRANLISTFPVDVFRRVNGIQVEMTPPPIIVNPGGERVSTEEWLYSTQVDLDRSGNAFGLITQRSGNGLPARIDLVPVRYVSIRTDQYGQLESFHIAGETFAPADVWHEKQYTIPGFIVGLSPIAYAAWSIAEYQSIQDFALTWFGGGGVPRGHLKNTMQTLSPTTADAVKAKFKSTVTSGDVFVTGADWEYSMLQAEQTGMEWLEAKRYGITDIARFFDVPADLIEAPPNARGMITYANQAQRNLQFLLLHLAPAIIRREKALSTLLPKPQYVKFNTDALLRLDPMTRAQMFETLIGSRVLTPDEARELENRPPLTPAQVAMFHDLFGDPNNPATPH